MARGSVERARRAGAPSMQRVPLPQTAKPQAVNPAPPTRPMPAPAPPRATMPSGHAARDERRDDVERASLFGVEFHVGPHQRHDAGPVAIGVGVVFLADITEHNLVVAPLRLA